MKSIAHNSRHLFAAWSALTLSATVVHAGTISTTFSFQQGDLQKDGAPYGSADTYGGVLDGHIIDNNPAVALSAGAATTIGNQFQSGIGTGRNYVGLFSYDLTELNDFITANTSASTSVTVTSVSLKLIASGNTSGGAHAAIGLYQTDPFTSAATWPTTDGTNAWTDPYQDLSDETQFRYTGGGSALTANLGATSPGTGGKSAGSPLDWTTSANFVASLNDALARPDKTLYLMAARGLQNSDGRVPVNSSNAVTVDDRPELVVTVAVSTLSDWTGATSTSWANAANWISLPGTGDNVRFNDSSIANLDTVVDLDLNLNGISLIDPSGPVSIGGTNTLTLGVGGLDLSAAVEDLTITAPLTLSSAQIWNVASGRSLNVGGAVTGSGDLTVFGNGTLSLDASNILPNGTDAGNLIVSGTLDLNGTSQSVNALTGAGIVDNTAAGASVLTIGNNNAGGTFNGTLQETSGSLSVVKTGSGNLGLTGANAFSGGFTNNGSGNVTPNDNMAFGTGPVVSNAGTIYATATTTFANTLALNSSTLRIGGGNSRTITWNGPVTVTGTSGLTCDGGTGGITLGSTLDITGATFTSSANGAINNFNGDISGAGGNLSVAVGTHQFSGANTYTGTTTLSNSGVFRLQPTGTISSSSNVVINDTGNFNIRNTVGWVYTGTVSGADTGSININSGTDAELAGDISGVANINVNSVGTDTTISGDISGITNVNVQNSGAPILRLSGNNSYSGNTTIANTGILVLESANALPDASAVTIASGTLDATVVGSDSAGALSVTGAATINLGVDANLAFADSSAADWTGGTLELTGTFVSGASLRFGTDENGLTETQLGLISAGGFDSFALDANGFLTANVAAGYSDWQTANGTTQTIDLDHDNDGVSNGVEYFLGGNSDTTGFTPLPGVIDLSVTWVKASTGYAGTYGTDFVVETSDTLATDSWVTAVEGTGPGEVEITGNNVKFTFPAGSKKFARLRVTGP